MGAVRRSGLATRFVMVLLGTLVLSCAPKPVRAPTAAPAPRDRYWEPPERAKVALGPDWLDVRFPPVDQANVGCTVSHPRETMYFWSFSLGYSDAAHWGGHSARVDVKLIFRDSVPVTAPRIDSALAEIELVVEEVVGSHLMLERTPATRAWARLEKGSLHLRIEGEAALRELRRPGGDTVALLWCRRHRSIGYTLVPLVTQ